jgi:hypothetical protein
VACGRRNNEINLISFEKPQDWKDAKRMDTMRKRMAEALNVANIA